MARDGVKLAHDAEGLNAASWPVPAGEFVTPVERFFTRSHAEIPQIDPDTWRLQVDGLVQHPRTFSLQELTSTFPRRQSTATLVCAGLRRQEFLALGPLPGELPWGPEPVSTGCWSGFALRDVLAAVGVAEGAGHVELVGLDAVERQGQAFGFGGSIDLSKALSKEVLLATELDGVPLPAAHGFPLRAVVPGWIGARSVKWLGRITLRAEPSLNYFQTKAYRVQRQIDLRDPRDVSAGSPLSEVPLNAVILHPVPDGPVSAGTVRVHGWAMGSAGLPVTGVELSWDDGRTWMPATITNLGSVGTWSLWEAAVELPAGRHQLVVRAFDQTGVAQPQNIRETWNVKGYCNNAWHRVTVSAE